MQNVSQAWKDNQNNQLVSESFVEISLDLTDPEASANASISSNTAVYFSNINGLIDGDDENVSAYATLEQNMWLLNGSRKMLSADNSVADDAGLVTGYMSNESRDFISEPRITLDFPEVYENTIPGITITWSETLGEYATEFTVRACKDYEVLNEVKITGNTEIVSSVFMDMRGYNKIIIDIEKWCLPFRRARVENILLGVRKVYTKSDIFSYSHSQEMDIVVADLPKNTVSFKINNIDREYDFRNATGLSKYLMEKQELKVRYGYKLPGGIEWIDGGVFYLSKWEAGENTNSISFEGVSLLETLTMIYGDDEMPTTERSLYDIAQVVLEYANLPLTLDGKVRWVLDESLKDVMTMGTLPAESVANCLQYIANAGCCALYCDRKGIIHIEKIDYVPDDYVINKANSFAKPELSVSNPIKDISMTYDTVDAETDEVYLASTGTFSIRKRELWKFVLPYKYEKERVKAVDVSLITLFPRNYNIVYQSLGSSMAQIHVVPTYASGTITDNAACIKVVGKIATVDSADVILPVSEESIEGETISIHNPIISTADHALVVAEWVRDSIIKRQTMSLSWRSDPRTDIVDVIGISDDYGENNVILTKIDYTYNGAFKGTAEGRVI